MKKSELRKLVKEELSKVINEAEASITEKFKEGARQILSQNADTINNAYGIDSEDFDQVVMELGELFDGLTYQLNESEVEDEALLSGEQIMKYLLTDKFNYDEAMEQAKKLPYRERMETLRKIRFYLNQEQ